MRARLAHAALAALVTVSAACLPKPPKPATIEPAKAIAIELGLVDGSVSYCPHGDPPQLRGIVTLADGKRVATHAAGESIEGRLEHRSLEWTTSWGMVDDAGYLQLPRDPFAALGRDVTIAAQVIDRPDLRAELTLAPRFDCGGFVGGSGASGQGGWGGQGGAYGRAGQSGDTTRAATDGEDGGHGQDGGDAGDGADGPVIEVSLAYVETERHGRLVLVRVRSESGGGPSVYLVDPAGASFVVGAIGGAGGDGGGGGSGGSGGGGGSNGYVDGGDGGHGGHGGDGGNGGHGGDGGRGGMIIVRVDDRHPELAELIGFDTSGGRAGSAGYGGYGGSGGSGGSSTSGRAGQGGRSGMAGQQGAPGRPGADGRGTIVEPADVRSLFAAEISRGVPVVTP